MKLNPANPTPGIISKKPVTNEEVIDALVATLIAIDDISRETFRPNSLKTAWDKVNAIRNRI